MAKLRVAFDIDGNWDAESFRLVIKDLVYEAEKYDVYLITQNTDSDYVDGIVTQLGMDSANVYDGLANNAAILSRLDASAIKIFLTNDMPMFTLTNDDSVDTVGILVKNAIQDVYQINPKWFDQLQFWILRLTQINGQEGC